MNRTLKDYFGLVARGVCIGAADVVPGVSGGTIAFITGIYEELVNSIKAINFTAIKLLLTLRIADFWRTINGNFLISVFFGIMVSVFSLAKLIEYLLTTYPVLVWSFFLGLIIASTVYIAKTITTWNAVNLLSAVAGCVAAYFITVISPAEANMSYWFIFVSGAIAICAMILPGISGSFILVLLGMYRFILDAVGNLNVAVILIFASGALIGIIAFSNVLSWLLKKYRNQTIALLTGFMFGSLNKVWPWKQATEILIGNSGEITTLMEKNIMPTRYEELTGNPDMLVLAIVVAATGFALIFIIENLTKTENKKD